MASSFEGIRNSNEARVEAILGRIVAEAAVGLDRRSDREDVYALSLNLLPARYLQRRSLVLMEPVTDEVIEEAVHRAIVRVLERPTRRDGPDGAVS